MGFGVDTASYLSDISWTDFYAWKPLYPAFADRYFGGGASYQSGEFKAAYQATHDTLSRIIPIQADVEDPNNMQTRQQTTGTTGYDYGAEDANATCATLAGALRELNIPNSGAGQVLLYMDIEANVRLTPGYWAGWANAVFNYGLNTVGQALFLPAIYTQYVNPNNQPPYSLNSYVADALNNASTDWPGNVVQCYRLWSANPENCALCAPDASADWSVFTDFYQTINGSSILVPLYLYQYAEPGVCDPCVTNYAGGKNLDLDGSDSTGAETYMLEIIS